jgi:hypothetical protein
MNQVLGSILTFIESHTMLIGIALILFQLYLQHRSTLAAQTEKMKDDLRLRIFDELNASLKAASRAFGISTAILLLPDKIAHFWKFIDEPNIPSVRLKERADLLRKAHADLSARLSEVTDSLERYEIVIKGIAPARQEFCKKCGEVNSLFSGIFSYLLRFLPFDYIDHTGTAQVKGPLRPSQADFSKFKNLCDEYYQHTLTIQCYLWDLSHISQNSLLGDMFPNRLGGRKPAKPKEHKVLQIPMKKKKIVNE